VFYVRHIIVDLWINPIVPHNNKNIILSGITRAVEEEGEDDPLVQISVLLRMHDAPVTLQIPNETHPHTTRSHLQDYSGTHLDPNSLDSGQRSQKHQRRRRSTNLLPQKSFFSFDHVAPPRGPQRKKKTEYTQRKQRKQDTPYNIHNNPRQDA
jgi:hypothetical protein